MSNDNYTFAKSEAPQGFDLESPFVSKQFNYVNDINSGVYASSGLSLVQFDLSSIYNSSGFLAPADMYVTIPICYSCAYSSSFTTGTLLTPTAGDWAQLGLKCGFWNLISSADLVVDGKPLESYQPNTNAYVGFKMLSQMSQDDITAMGMTLGMGRQIDNPASIRYNNQASATTAGVFGALAVGPIGGNGLSNNVPFATPSGDGDQPVDGAQGGGTYNVGYYTRLNRITDVSSTVTSSGLYNVPSAGAGSAGTGIMSTNQCLNEFRPTFQILNSSYACWQDIAVVRLKDLFDSIKQFPLVKKFDAQLRLYINVGAVGIQLGVTGTQITSLSSNTFTNTCPLMISALLSAVVPATTIALVAGLSIARQAPTNFFGSINLATSGSSNALTSCRVYYPMVELKPEKAISYLAENRAKKVCYTSILSNTYNNITSGSTFSTLVQSGVQRIRGVVIIPFLSGSTNGLLSVTNAVTAISTFSDMLSPFSCAPMQNGPISLINVNCAVGGRNVLQNSLQYTYQDWIEQVSAYEKIGQGDLGVSCGLLSQYAWENAYRMYYIDCTRGTQADGASLRNLTVTFNNNTLQTIDCLIFTEYFTECEVNVADGRITK